MRIVGGSHRGRRLVAPAGRTTRPTSDRVREAVFSSLGGRLPGMRVLDLYAGSGALGLEALSRGASTVTFVEHDRRTAAVIRRNLRDLALDPGRGGGVVVNSARSFCQAPTGGPFSLVLADPPYDAALPDVLTLVGALRHADAVTPGARVVVERSRRDPALTASGEPRVPLPAFLAFDRCRSYGDTVVLHLVVGDEPNDRSGVDQPRQPRCEREEQAES